MADCHKLVENLSDYIDGQLEPGLCAELEKHLDGCTNCRLMFDSLKMTVKLCKDGSCEELPEALRKKLDLQLAERWKKKFGHL